MAVHKIAITLEETLLQKIDRLVRSKAFPNRSKAIQEAVSEKIQRMDRNRLAREAAKLDQKEEQALADLGISTEADQWPVY